MVFLIESLTAGGVYGWAGGRVPFEHFAGGDYPRGHRQRELPAPAARLCGTLEQSLC